MKRFNRTNGLPQPERISSLQWESKRQTNDSINFIGIRWGKLPIRTKTTKDKTNCRKRKKPDSGNEAQDSLPFSSHSSSVGSETVNERSPGRPVHDSDSSVTFKTLWAELAGVESHPRYWELFTAVCTIETMHQSWHHNNMAVKLVQHNISPSEAAVICDLMETLSPTLRSLILDIDANEDRTALENAFGYNSAWSCFSSRLRPLRRAPLNRPT
ncbi:unnamed protein product [Penicillium egyptiacum]|uniref:Uncharacterized protein n=1 Tax=Penicillium egyptiacum TaxID=1303716 RepID=A0A9W4KAE4_9EURO|nr:unnamed protein product [Penicillium egyptiacum]